MPIINNNLNSRILIHIKGSKYIDLLEKSTAEVTNDDLLSSHLQGLIQRGFVNIGSEGKKDVKKEEENQKPSKEKEVNAKEEVRKPSEGKKVITEETAQKTSNEEEVKTAEMAQKPNKEKEVNTEKSVENPSEENEANIEEK